MSERTTSSGRRRARKRPPAGRRPERAASPRRSEGPGPARLYALTAGALLALLGVLGFFYDAGFATGSALDGDDLAGILIVNGWRNLIYLLSGLLALAFAARRPRATATALAAFYLLFGLWGLLATEHGIGSILDFLPLVDADNTFHLIVGGLGALAALADGPLPHPPRLRIPRPARRRSRRRGAATRGSGGRAGGRPADRRA